LSRGSTREVGPTRHARSGGSPGRQRKLHDNSLSLKTSARMDKRLRGEGKDLIPETPHLKSCWTGIRLCSVMSTQLIATQPIRVRIGRPFCCRARGAGALSGDGWMLRWGGMGVGCCALRGLGVGQGDNNNGYLETANSRSAHCVWHPTADSA
jgi:hypothetical protein